MSNTKCHSVIFIMRLYFAHVGGEQAVPLPSLAESHTYAENDVSKDSGERGAKLAQESEDM